MSECALGLTCVCQNPHVCDDTVLHSVISATAICATVRRSGRLQEKMIIQRSRGEGGAADAFRRSGF